MKKDLTLTNFLSVINIYYSGMNKLDYLRENIGALTTGTLFGGFWIPVLTNNIPAVYVAGISATYFASGYYGYKFIKESDKQRANFRNRTFSKEKDLIDILEE